MTLCILSGHEMHRMSRAHILANMAIDAIFRLDHMSFVIGFSQEVIDLEQSDIFAFLDRRKDVKEDPRQPHGA